MALLLLILPLLVSASQRPLPPGFEEASWKKVGFKIVVDVKKFIKLSVDVTKLKYEQR